MSQTLKLQKEMQKPSGLTILYLKVLNGHQKMLIVYRFVFSFGYELLKAVLIV